jgi:hypothetical protein
MRLGVIGCFEEIMKIMGGIRVNDGSLPLLSRPDREKEAHASKPE